MHVCQWPSATLVRRTVVRDFGRVRPDRRRSDNQADQGSERACSCTGRRVSGTADSTTVAAAAAAAAAAADELLPRQNWNNFDTKNFEQLCDSSEHAATPRVNTVAFQSVQSALRVCSGLQQLLLQACKLSWGWGPRRPLQGWVRVSCRTKRLGSLPQTAQSNTVNPLAQSMLEVPFGPGDCERRGAYTHRRRSPAGCLSTGKTELQNHRCQKLKCIVLRRVLSISESVLN